MKKMLYICPILYNGELKSGVEKKVFQQCKNFSSVFDTYLLCYSKEGIVLIECSGNKKTVISKGYGGINVLKNVLSLKRFFDYVYVRYPLSSLSLIRAVRHLYKYTKKIVIEIATYPYESELKKGLKNRIMLILDKLFRRKLKHYVDRIVTFSSDERIYGIETIRTRNGVDYSSCSIAPYVETKEIHLIAVSSVYYLHGYDRIIKGLSTYYKDNKSPNIVFDIVGEGPYLKLYQNLVSDFGLHEHVLFHGKCFGKELESLYAKSLIAINSLAIHRENLKTESTIKSKEYAAKGLPIVSSFQVDSFTPEDNERFVFRVPENDEEVNIKQLLEYVRNLYKKCPVEKIRRRIREKSMQVSDIKVVMQPIIDFYLN